MRTRSKSSEIIGFDDALLARVRKQAWFHRYPRGWPFLLFVITSISTAASVIAIERADRLARSAELDRNATEIAAGLQRRASENIALLRAGAALFGSRDDVSPEEFDEFAGGIYVRGDHRGAVGIGWAPLISASNVPALEARQRARGYQKFTVWPVPDATGRPMAPVVEVVPLDETTKPALGFDMFSEPVRRAAMEEAMRTDQPVATGLVRLVHSNIRPNPAGFLIYMPVHRREHGHRNAIGFVYSPFSVESFLDSAAELYTSRGVEIAVYDREVRPDRLMVLRQAPGEIGASLDRSITIGGREWMLRVSARRPGMLTPLSRATLIFGIVIGLLSMFTARVITRRAVDDRKVLEWLTRQAAIRTQLTRELNHRVKNTLANVLSIVSLTRRRTSSLDEFSETVTARIRALSATHDLLSESDWTDAEIGEIVRSELAPYIQGATDQIVFAGPGVRLAPNDALSLGLAIHELATNAAKYGALTSPEGKVRVDWRLMSPDLAEVRWRETGGPAVSPPSKRGFGRDLVEKIVAHELRSEVELNFRPEGVECILRVPVRRAGEFALRRTPDR